MQINSQEVTQAPGNNTVFQTWLLSGDENACKKGFERPCALVVNLNKTAKVRFATLFTFFFGYFWSRLSSTVRR